MIPGQPIIWGQALTLAPPGSPRNGKKEVGMEVEVKRERDFGPLLIYIYIRKRDRKDVQTERQRHTQTVFIERRRECRASHRAHKRKAHTRTHKGEKEIRDESQANERSSRYFLVKVAFSKRLKACGRLHPRDKSSHLAPGHAALWRVLHVSPDYFHAFRFLLSLIFPPGGTLCHFLVDR